VELPRAARIDLVESAGAISALGQSRLAQRQMTPWARVMGCTRVEAMYLGLFSLCHDAAWVDWDKQSWAGRKGPLFICFTFPLFLTK
jgi:hypothetical protein